jgi:pimeloyl-ACP methyl ester carboxylesterase
MVVFSHGYGHSSYSWKAHLARVAQRLNVITVAMDGRGLTFTGTFKSDGVTPNTSGWPVQAAADDGIAAAKLFESTCPGLGTIVNYGVSLGGNTSGIIAKTAAKRADGVTPMFDWWVDVEGVNNLVETYMEARGASPSAASDIQHETGGPIEVVGPDAYTARTNVLHTAEMKAAGLKGVVLVQGVDDGLVPYNQSQEMFDSLNAAGIAAQYFTVTLKSDESERETTLSQNVGKTTDPNYRSPLAGHASEMSTTHIVGVTGFERLDAIFGGHPPACTRVYWVDGQLGGAPTADDPAYAC